jgi:hypothetical protein
MISNLSHPTDALSPVCNNHLSTAQDCVKLLQFSIPAPHNFSRNVRYLLKYEPFKMTDPDLEHDARFGNRSSASGQRPPVR